MDCQLPIYCDPNAFRRLTGVTMTFSSPDALPGGAIAIASHWIPDADPVWVDYKIQRYVDAVRRCVHGKQPQALLAHLHHVLFEKAGFQGNQNQFYNPLNNFLPAVLETKLGAPVVLGMIYKLVAERLGLRVYGVGFPGNFLVAFEDRPGHVTLIDTFTGGNVVTRDEARLRFIDLYGSEMEWRDEFFCPINNRHWLTRITQNLLRIFGENGHYEDVAVILEMEMLMWPEQIRLKKDLALVLARMGTSKQAAALLAEYLAENPADPQTKDLKRLYKILVS